MACLTFEVRKPKVPEGCPEVTASENSDELTLRAEEVGTLKAHVNVDHIEKETWGPPLVDYDCCIKTSTEKIGKTCMFVQRNE